nr:MAG: putative capsid protein [Narnaviridae sp.]
MPRDCTALRISVSSRCTVPASRGQPILGIRLLSMSSKTSNTRSKTAKKRQANKPKTMEEKSTSVAVAYEKRMSFPYSSQQSRRISNRELLMSINGATAFTVAANLPINPGLSAEFGGFPWLSQTAATFQQYRFHKLSYHFISRVPTSTTGSVILSPEYNPAEHPPTSEREASNTQGAAEGVCWSSLTVRLDPQAMFASGQRKLIRSSNVPGDYNLYDAGQLNVCVVGQAGASEIGKLWVEYDVELFVPQSTFIKDPYPSSIAEFSCTGSITWISGTNTRFAWDLLWPSNLRIPAPVSGSFLMPRGAYLIQTWCVAQNTMSEVWTFQMEVQKDSAAMNPQCFAKVVGAAKSPGQILINLVCGFVSDGTNALTVLGVPVGTGTLSSTWQNQRLIIQRV